MPTASPGQRKSKSLYSVHPGVLMVQDWIAALKTKTGRSLGEWMKFIEKDGPADEPARRDWLKMEHGLGTNTAHWLAERSVGKGANEDSPESYLKQAEVYVREQCEGKKAPLKPLFDRLFKLGLSMGKDARACPCKTMVPLYRGHVFAQIKPTTNTRIDLGLYLTPMPETKIPKGRLIATGGREKKDRITHRIGIERMSEIDAFVGKWLKTAYTFDVS